MDITISDETDNLDNPPKRVETQWHVVDVLQISFPVHEIKEAAKENDKQKILLTISEFDAREYSVYDVQKYPEQLLDSSGADKEHPEDVEEDGNNESTDMEDITLHDSQNDVLEENGEIQRYASTESSEVHIDTVPEGTYILEESMETRDTHRDTGVTNLRGDTSTESLDVQEGSLEDWGLREPSEDMYIESRSTQEARGDTSTESMDVQIDTASESGPLLEALGEVNSEVDDGGGTPFSANGHLDTKDEVDMMSIHEHLAGQLCSHEVEWADYWNNWKDTLVNLAWVQRFSHHCKPDFQRWFAEYVHNYPNILPQILEGLEDFEEQQEAEKENAEQSVDNDEEEKRRKMDSLYERFSAHREVIHKRQYFSSQGWANISCCGKQSNSQDSWPGRQSSKEDAGHACYEDTGVLSEQNRKESLGESDSKALEEENKNDILEESDSSETRGKLTAAKTTKSKRAASPAKLGGRRKKSKKSGKSFSVASVIQFLQEVEEAKKENEKSLTIEEASAMQVGPLTDGISNVVNVLNGSIEGKTDSHKEITTKKDDDSVQLSEKLDTSTEIRKNMDIHRKAEVTLEQYKQSDVAPTDSSEIDAPGVESLENPQKLLCSRSEEECKSDSKNVEPSLVEANVFCKEETSVEQFRDDEAKETRDEESENREAELGKEDILIEMSENHKAELIDKEEMPLEESRNYGMELGDKIETSVEQSENHEIELVVRKEPLLEEMNIFEAAVEQHENFESEPIKEETSLKQHENFESEPIKEETSLEQHENFESEPIKEETSLEQHENFESEPIKEETTLKQHENFESEPIKEETSLEQHENFETEPIKEETSVEQHENFESELIKEETSVEQHKKHEPELVSREENVLEHHENHKGLFVREETVDQSENYKAELISMENTVVGQSETKEELVISSELIEHSKDCEVELVSTGETSVEQPKNYKTELIDRKETSIKHSDKYEVELVGGKQTQVNKKRKRKRQEDAKVVVKGEVRGERVTTVGVIGATRKNSTKNVGAAGDFEKESSLFGIMDTVKSFTQLVISSTVQGLFNAIFVPWQSESFTLPDQLSPVTNFISKIRKWQEKKRIMNKNKNTLEKFFSKNRLSSTTNKWPQALQNFSVEVQTYKKKKYNKIKWSLGIYVTDEEERRKVTINMEDVPSLENGVVYFKKNKSYMTSIKEPPADLPPALHKYWNQRHRLFYKFDEGIKLDHESWYSATPECIAVHHALRCACSIVVDAFCGAGGNAIQFAFSCSHVIAIDIDKAKIEIARHNAKVYGVADRIEFIVGDFFQLAPTLKADVVFLSPPWGGPEYLSSPVYDLANLSGDITASRLMEAAHKISHNVALFLPKNTNIKQLLCMGSRENRKISVEMNKIGRKPKALTVYYGDIADYWEEDL